MGDTSQSMPNGWTEAAFRRFWQRMGEIFGRSWYEQHGPEPTASWSASLAGLSLDQVAATIHHYSKSGDAFPPNLSQFVSTARQFRSHPAHVALPPPRSSAEAVDHGVRSMRAAIRMGGRRQVLLPGESVSDYMAALNAAKANGQSKHDFDQDRLRRNGWTDQDEETYRRNAAGCGVRVR